MSAKLATVSFRTECKAIVWSETALRDRDRRFSEGGMGPGTLS